MGAGADILGGIGDFVGGLLGSGDRDDAMKYLEQARQGYQGLKPTIFAQQTGPSAYLSADPSTRAAQMDALANLRNQISQGGLDAVTRSNLAQIQAQNAQQANTSQAAVMDAAARRGMANSGNTLVAQQLAGQQAAQRNAMQGLQQGAIEQQNRMAAIQGEGNLAGGIRAQDYDRAAALDSINRFNASQRQGAEQSTFQNSLAQQNGVASGYGAQAAQKNGDAQKTQQMWGGIGRAVGAVGDAVATGAPDGEDIQP